MSGTASLQQFQRYVWESLPIRKEAIEREVIDDLVMIAVQCWPAEKLSQTDTGTQEELVVLSSVSADIRRMLTLIYGEDRFRACWIVALRSLIPQAVGVINHWWQRRKDNRAKLNTWRRKWSVE